MKRFWDAAWAAPEAAGWCVLLDGKPVRVPGGSALILPTVALAHAVAEEWARAGGAIGGEPRMDDLPLTRLAGTARERVAPDPEPLALELARYGGSDLLCYRADRPEALAKRQRAAWQPWLDWVERAHGARLKVAEGVMHVTQDPASLAALAHATAAVSPWALAALGVAVPALGSLVLGLALHEGVLTADEAYALSALDESFQAEQWGEDTQATERRAGLRGDVASAARFMALLTP